MLDHHYDTLWSYQIHQHRRGTIPSHDIAHNPVRDPYSDCRKVNNQLLYHGVTGNHSISAGPISRAFTR
jgi:hypothetical protein